MSHALRYVACVSYPRSGHHLTERVLRAYFGTPFGYCSVYGVTGCCRAVPCERPGVTMTKNHDDELNRDTGPGLARLPGVPYLVLVRSFLDAVVSDYELYTYRGYERDTESVWRDFASRKAGFYRRFVRKWVLGPPTPDTLVMTYEQLTDEPQASFAQVVRHVQPGALVDASRLAAVLATARMQELTPAGVLVRPEVGVRSTRRVEDFRYADRRHFAALERSLRPELRALGYPVRYARWPGLVGRRSSAFSKVDAHGA